jgi:hypothetical protein
MTEQDRANIVATINGMSEEELEVVVTCISDAILGRELASRLYEARKFKDAVMNLIENEK